MKDMLRHCLNPKVLVGLGLAGVLIWFLRPDLIRSVFPVLLVLACPLSMSLMMFGMRNTQAGSRPDLEKHDAPPKDRTAELKARLAAAQAEQDAVQTELNRLDRESSPK